MFEIKKQKTAIVLYWLILSIGALAIAGLFAILLVAARSPVIQEFLPWVNAFQTALTIHVNLSVLVWFIAFGCVLWNIATSTRTNLISRIAFSGAIAGVLVFVFSPFIEAGKPLLNNYVPILDSQLFVFGIILFLASVFLQAINMVLRPNKSGSKTTEQQNLFNCSIYYSAIIYIISILALPISYIQISNSGLALDSAAFYEMLFWASGHLLQLFYTQIMLIAWLWLATEMGFKPTNKRLYIAIMSINMVIVCASFFICFYYPAYDGMHFVAFTDAMRYFGGISALLLGGIIFYWLVKHWKNTQNQHLRWVLLWSIFIFASGGVLGYTIDGINTVIPAHYHGSIVGVTLALMAIALNLLPKLGFAVINVKMITLQSFIYGVGQLLHITGLAWSGGYGALRKTPGAISSLEGQAAMGLMGLGGLLSIGGGIFFVVICIKSLVNKQKTNTQ